MGSSTKLTWFPRCLCSGCCATNLASQVPSTAAGWRYVASAPSTSCNRPPVGLLERLRRMPDAGSAAPIKSIGIVRVCRVHLIAVTTGPTAVHPHVAAIGPTQVRKRLRERREPKLFIRIVFIERPEHADAPHAVTL